MTVTAFALTKLPASDWYLLLITVPLFLVGVWLLCGELRNWAQPQKGRYTEPSHIAKLLISIFGQHTTQVEREAEKGAEVRAEKKAA